LVIQFGNVEITKTKQTYNDNLYEGLYHVCMELLEHYIIKRNRPQLTLVIVRIEFFFYAKYLTSREFMNIGYQMVKQTYVMNCIQQ
jgi:hypothetical protein